MVRILCCQPATPGCETATTARIDSPMRWTADSLKAGWRSLSSSSVPGSSTMRSPWRVTAPSPGLLVTRILSAILVVGCLSSAADAQSDQAVPATAALGSSLSDAVRQNENDLIDRTVLGGRQQSGATAIGAFATGRLRRSDHDGLDSRSIARTPNLPGIVGKTFDYETDEASVFANVIVALPQTVMGGRLQFSGFVGYNWLDLDLQPNALNPVPPGQRLGGADNESVIAGGTILWSQDTVYALATVTGNWGETEVDDQLTLKLNGRPQGRIDYDTSGFTASGTAGNVFALSSSPQGLMLDVRGTIAYAENESDRFLNTFGDAFELEYSTWTGTGALMLFSNLTVQDNAVLRPFVQGYVRREWDYHNEIEFTGSNNFAFSQTAFDQSHTYAGIDTGVSYAVQNVTVGGSVYVEGSSDEETVGGRLGATWKLN